MPRYDRSVTLVDSAGNSVNLGNPLPTTGGGGGGGGAVTVAEGADVCEGATTDAAVTGDNPGTVSAKLRGINKIFTDVWDSVNHAFKVNLVSGSAGQADNSTFTEGTTSFTPVGGEYNTVPGDVTDGKAAAAQITQKRAIHTNLRDATGTELGTLGSPVRIDPTGVTTQPVSGSVSVSNFPATQPVSVGDGQDVSQGATTDAAITSDTNGTVIGFLRGLVKIFASVWDSLNGRLKVDASAVPVPVTDNSGSLTIDGTVTIGETFTPDDLLANGPITGIGQSVFIPLFGCSSVSLEVRSIWAGTLSFFIQAGSGNQYAVSGRNLATGVIESSTTVNGNWVFPVGGFGRIVIVSTAWTSGTASLNLRGGIGVNCVHLASALPAGTNDIGGVSSTETRPTSTTSVIDLLAANDATRVLTILAANANRRGATIRNDTDTALLIREGGSASPTNYTDILPAGARYTLDYPASTAILTAYLPQVPNGQLIATERS